MSVSGAIQPRINKAIIDRLRADTIDDPQTTGTSLQEAMQEVGAVIVPEVPLYFASAPPSASKPFILYGPQDRQGMFSRTLCGSVEHGEALYEVGLVTDGNDPGAGIAVIDRLFNLLSGYSVTVEGVTVGFWPEAPFIVYDSSADEAGLIYSGTVWLCRVSI